MDGSTCLVAARKSGVLLKTSAGGSGCESVASTLPEFLRPVYETLLQTKQGFTDLQVIGSESGDTLLIPTSGFYLVAHLPAGKLDQTFLGMWKALAVEIQR